MERIITYIGLILTSLLCGAKEITIRPQFEVGDTLRYRTTAQVIVRHGADSMVTTTKMQPQLIVEGKNDVGFILATANKLESVGFDCPDPEANNRLPDKTGEINDFVTSLKLRIQLNSDCRPDSILNLDEVKESTLDAFIKMFAREQGIDVEDSAEWEMDTKPLLIGTVDMVCTPKHLIEEQFGNIPYFNFVGIPLESGKIPTSMVLTDQLQGWCPDLKYLDIDVNAVELNVSEEDGVCCIRIKEKDDKAEVEGELSCARGILTHGFISVKTEYDAVKLISNFTIDAIR